MAELEYKEARKVGEIHTKILQKLKEVISPGVSKMELEKYARSLLKKFKVKSGCLGKRISESSVPYPAALCVATNSQAVHVYPKEGEILHDGDIVNVDLVVFSPQTGIFTDAAFSVVLFDGKVVGYPQILEEYKDYEKSQSIPEKIKKRLRLLFATYKAMLEAIKVIKAKAFVAKASAKIFQIAKKFGVLPLADFGGHGIGKKMWEEPFVPNRPPLFYPFVFHAHRMVAIEPLFSTGSDKVIYEDSWRTRIKDGGDFCQTEITLYITENDAKFVTDPV